MESPQTKSKDLRAAERPGFLVQRFKQEDARSDDPGRGHWSSRPELANEISSYLFGYLHEYRIPTHFVENSGGACMLVRQLAMFPLRIRVWNTAHGSYARRFGLREGQDLPFPVLEQYFRRDGAPDTLVNDQHLLSLGVLTPEEFRTVNRLASRANAVLRSLFARRELRLLSLSLQCGRSGGQIMIGDELTPRTCTTADARGRSARQGDRREDPYRMMRDRLVGAGAVER